MTGMQPAAAFGVVMALLAVVPAPAVAQVVSDSTPANATPRSVPRASGPTLTLFDAVALALEQVPSLRSPRRGRTRRPPPWARLARPGSRACACRRRPRSSRSRCSSIRFTASSRA